MSTLLACGGGGGGGSAASAGPLGGDYCLFGREIVLEGDMTARETAALEFGDVALDASMLTVGAPALTAHQSSFLFGASPALTLDSGVAPSTGTASFTVGPNGALTLDPGGDALLGFVRSDGSAFGLADTSGSAGFGGLAYWLALRKSIGADSSLLSGPYGALFMVLRHQLSGGTMATVGSQTGQAALSFAPGASAMVTLAAVGNGQNPSARLVMDTMGGGVLECAPDALTGTSAPYSVDPDGTVTIPAGGLSPQEMHGLATTDGQFLCLVSVDEDSSGAPNDVSSESIQVLAVKRPSALVDPCGHVAGTWNLLVLELRYGATRTIRWGTSLGTLNLTSSGTCSTFMDGSAISSGTLVNDEVLLQIGSETVTSDGGTDMLPAALPFTVTADGQVSIEGTEPGETIDGFVNAAGDVMILISRSDDPDPMSAGQCLSSRGSVIVAFRAP